MTIKHADSQAPLHSRLIDATVLLGLALITCYSLRKPGWHALPAEDASMLIRYAQHLAQGHGIVWNLGERPVDYDCNLCRSVQASLEYVQTHNYTLAAVWGYNLCDRHYGYVRNGLPETKTFIDIVSHGPVFISDGDTGHQMLDLRGVPLPTESGCNYPSVHLPLSE